MKIGIQAKITLLLFIGLASVTAALVTLAIIGMNGVGHDVTDSTLSWMLESDLVSARARFSQEFGQVELQRDGLYDSNGSKIGNNHRFVDGILEDYRIAATVFGREGNDFIRLTTNIRLEDDSRAVGTYLGEDSAAYPTVIDGQTFIGEAMILGIPYLTAYDPILSNRGEVIGILFIGIPEAEIFALIDDSIIQNTVIQLVVAVGILVAVSLIVYFVSKRISLPISRIAGSLKEIASGDADLTKKLEVISRDETGQVAESFNSFVSTLRVLMEELKKIIGRTDMIRISIGESTEETSSAIDQISANLGSIRDQMDVLDGSISETVSAIEEVTANMTSVDEQIINQSAMVEESTAAITEMIASLNSVTEVAQNKRETTKALSRVADEGKALIQQTSGTFKSVVDHIRRIQEMASTINDIASQTNLLSMNAAIEAAHAGDSGRGFAVVAEEIRKLADSAGRSSQSISQTISDITNSVLETDQNVIQTTSAFERISSEVEDTINAFAEIEQAVTELNTGGRQILDSTNEISEVTVTIRNGSNEIKNGTKLMMDNSAVISQVSERVSSGMTESSKGAEEIVSAMKGLLARSQELSSIVVELQDRFGQFKT